MDIFWVLHRVVEFIKLLPWRWRHYGSPNHRKPPSPTKQSII